MGRAKPDTLFEMRMPAAHFIGNQRPGSAHLQEIAGHVGARFAVAGQVFRYDREAMALGHPKAEFIILASLSPPCPEARIEATDIYGGGLGHQDRTGVPDEIAEAHPFENIACLRRALPPGYA